MALALGAGGVPAYAADAEAVIADYRADARLDAGHEVEDLRGALRARAGDPQLPGFAAAVQDELDELLLGRKGGDPVGAPGSQGGVGDRELRALEVAPTPAATPPPPLALPEPRAPSEATHPPWAFVALSAAGGLLVMCGLLSGLYRRVRRPAHPAR